jgi:hypothetical protein
VYGQEAVLPWEITAGSRRIEFQKDLTAEEYATLMTMLRTSQSSGFGHLKRSRKIKPI